MKKFYSLHPLTLSREHFFIEINKIKQNKITDFAGMNELEIKLGNFFKTNCLNLHEEFEDCESSHIIPA